MKKIFLVGCSVLAVMTFGFNSFAAGKMGWVQDKNTWKYYKTESEVSKGWIHSGDGWYYLNEQNGNMETGWKLLGGAWFFLDTRSGANMGKALTGWQWIDGYCYYFSTEKNGNEAKLLVNTKTPDGFMVNADGRWTVDGKVQYRANYGIITKKSIGTKTSTRKSFGGGSGGSGGGSGRSSGGSNQGGMNQGGNGGSNQGGMNQGGNGGSNQGDMNQGGNGGSNQGDMNQGGNGGSNQGDMNQGGNGGSNQGDMNQGGNGGSNQGDMNQGGNGGSNQGDMNQGGNGGNNQDNDANRPALRPVPFSEGIVKFINQRFGNNIDTVTLVFGGASDEQAAEYFNHATNIKLNGRVIEKSEILIPNPLSGVYSYVRNYLVFNFNDVINGDNLLEIESDGYENYVVNFNYRRLERNPISEALGAVEIGDRVSVIFVGEQDVIGHFLSTVSSAKYKKADGSYTDSLTKIDIEDDTTVPNRGEYGTQGRRLILNREDVFENTGEMLLESEEYESKEFMINIRRPN